MILTLRELTAVCTDIGLIWMERNESYLEIRFDNANRLIVNGKDYKNILQVEKIYSLRGRVCVKLKHDDDFLNDFNIDRILWEQKIKMLR